jgi:hypothetical protein
MWTEALTLAREGVPVFCTSAESALVDPRLRGRAAHSVVDALMYSLRRGVGELTTPDTLRRLSELDKTQIGDVCERCTRFQPHIARAWSRDEIVTLIEVWDRLRGVRINQ